MKRKNKERWLGYRTEDPLPKGMQKKNTKWQYEKALKNSIIQRLLNDKGRLAGKLTYTTGVINQWTGAYHSHSDCMTSLKSTHVNLTMVIAANLNDHVLKAKLNQEKHTILYLKQVIGCISR